MLATANFPWIESEMKPALQMLSVTERKTAWPWLESGFTVILKEIGQQSTVCFVAMLQKLSI